MEEIRKRAGNMRVEGQSLDGQGSGGRSNHRHRHRESEKIGFLEVLVIGILLSSVFLFGAVQEVVLAAEEFLIIFSFTLMFAWKIRKGEAIEKTPLFLPFIVFIISIMVQLLPLPAAIIRIISPQAFSLEQSLGGYRGVNTISLIPITTFYQLLRWITVFLIYLLVVNVFNKRNLSRLLNSLYFLSMFEAFYGLFLFFTGSQCLLWYCKPSYGDFGTRVHGTYRNPDHLAGYLEMVIPIHISQVISTRLPTPFRSEEKARKLLGIFFVTIFIITLFFTISRAGVTAFSLGMVYYYFSGKEKSRISKYRLYLKVLVALVFIYLLWIGIGPIIERFWELSANIHHGRTLVWKDTLNLVKDFPIFGTGFGTFQFIFTKYKTFPQQVFYDFAHNDYLQFLAEGGVISLLSFLWLVFRGLKMLVKGNTPIARGAAAGFIAILFHSFFDFNLQIPANAYIFSAILAIGWISRKGNHDRHPLPSTSEP